MRRVAVLLLLPALCFSTPKVKSVKDGVKISTIGRNTTIQAPHRSVINWETFSILQGERVEFIQPHTHSSVINRVESGVTLIDGLLQSNGRVFLLNPNGVLVGKNGIVSCASFLATTLDFDEGRCLGGKAVRFKGDSNSAIINCGTIEALSGDVILLAKAVINEGVLEAKQGIVGIAAAREVLLKPDGAERLFISMRDGEEASIENRGVIEAARAELKADGNVYRLAINQTGVIEATGIAEENGRIVLRAEGGSVSHSGVLCADSGEIHLLGDDVTIASGALLDVSGPTGGGEILIGGDYQGSNPDILNAKRVTFEQFASANASATEYGNGGKVILWGEESTAFFGSIESRGGTIQGDGGFVEISSPQALVYKGSSDLRPFNGEYGTLLLDPSQVVISLNATSGIQQSTTGVFVPVAGTANLSATDLTAALGTGNVIVTTQSNFSQPGDMTITDGFIWNAPTTLTLFSDRDVIIGPNESIEANAGGSVVIDCGRDFNMVNGGGIVATGSGIISITTRTGSCNVKSTASNFAVVTTVAGDISINARAGLNVSTPSTSGSPAEIFSQQGSVLINQAAGYEVSGDVILGESSFGQVSLGSSSGGVSIRTGRDLKLFGSVGANPTIVIGNSGISEYNIGRDLLIQGGSGGDGVFLGANDGDIKLRIGRDLSVIGGSNGVALLGFYNDSGLSTGGGRLDILEVGGDVLVQGGSGSDSFAIIGASPIKNDPWACRADIFMENIRGEVTVDGTQSSATIGLRSGENTTYFGNVGVEAQKDISLKAGKASAVIGGDSSSFVGPVASMTIPELRVQGQNIILNGGESQFGAIGFTTSFQSVNAEANIGIIDLKAQGAITLNPGTDTGAGPGTALIGVSTIEGNANARIKLEGDTVILNGASGSSGGLSQILTSSGTITAPRSILIEARNIDVGQVGTDSSSAEIIATRDLLAIAKQDVILRQASRVEADGDLTLVADFQGLGSLEIGDGIFEIYSGAQLNATGPLRIFTAKRATERFLIDAPLNGVAYVPGPLYVDTGEEQWGSAFPKNVGGFPFTIFYKTGLDPLWPTKSTRIFAEMFANLATYDQLLFDGKCFLFGYDRGCYDQLSHPRGMVSSFDLFSDETEYMLRQKYRNYRLKYVESF